MPSKAFCTFGIGPYKACLDIARPTFERYANRHGYDYIERRAIMQACPDAGRGLDERAPSWSKIPLMLELLMDYDAVLWVDCDVLILDDTCDLADEVPSEAIQALTLHTRFMGTDLGERPSAGLWYARPNLIPYLEQIWSMTEYLHHPWWEQAALHELLGYVSDGPTQRVKDTELFCQTHFLDVDWHNINFDEADSKARILHFPALPVPDRVHAMREWVRRRLPESQERAVTASLPFYVPVTLDPWESYGLIGLQLVRHLTRLGVEVDLYGLAPDLPRAHAFTPKGGIVLGPVDGYAYHGKSLWQGPHVAITMFESTRLPADACGDEGDWIASLNAMDAVIVPSRFCADAFAGSGVTVPIFTVPLGIGDTYQYKERAASRWLQAASAENSGQQPTADPYRTGSQQPLTFLAFIDRGERKGGHMALQAFLRAFGDDPNYKLILKSRKPRIGLEFTNPNIETIQADLSEEELYDLYCRCDVLINPHCGEGFGLLPREFAASGGLALTTGWSGTADELPRWGVGIPYRLVKAGWRDTPKYAGKDLGDWAQVDVNELAMLLREIAANWTTYHATLAAKAQAVRELYSWHEFAKSVLEVWETVNLQTKVLA